MKKPPVPEQTLGANGRMVWVPNDTRLRNAFCLFRLRFTLSSQPAAATLKIFADYRYRLYVNGRRVAYGPARSHPSFPEFDTVELGSRLHPGENELLAEVLDMRASSYQTFPENRGGFAAEGMLKKADGSTIDFSTPGQWQVKASQAREAFAQSFTFAQGPIEELDCARLQREMSDARGWRKPEIVKDGPWGEFIPRSIGPAEDRDFHPISIQGFLLQDTEEIIGCRLYGGEVGFKGRHIRFPYATWIHSPIEQGVEVGIFWGPHYCNGREVTCANDALRGNGARQNGTLFLREGWNLVYGEPEFFEEIWGIMIGLPRHAGLTARAEPDFQCANALRHGPLMKPEALDSIRKEPPATAEALARLPIAWRDVPIDARAPFPGRCIAWDLVESTLPIASPDEIEVPAEKASALVAHFGKAYGGWVRFAIEAPAGTLVDAAPCDRVRVDGLVDACHTAFFNSADRFILNGNAEIEGFHIRGGTHYQLSIRPPPGSRGTIKIKGFRVRSSCYDAEEAGKFKSSDPFFDWMWRVSANTLKASIEDAFIVDCYRERSIYAADSFMLALGGRCLIRDIRVEQRLFRLWDRNRRAYGYPASFCFPGKIGDAKFTPGCFSMMWVLWLHNYWSWTGDAALVGECLETACALLESHPHHTEPSGLWSGGGFADDGEDPGARVCKENGTLNSLRYGALIGAVEFARAIGQSEKAKAWASEALMVRQAMNDRLWDAAARRYRAGGDGNDADPIHANVAALANGCYTEDQRGPLLNWVRGRLLENHYKCLADQPGRIELQFLYYALEGLYKHGDIAAAEQVLRTHYGILYNQRRIASAERLVPNDISVNCNPWTCHPMWFLQRRTLGVQLRQNGDPDHLIVAPASCGLTSAEGTFPHAKGDVVISWVVDRRKLIVSIKAPEGVCIDDVRPGGLLKDLELVVNKA